jgi:hypothetical protein
MDWTFGMRWPIKLVPFEASPASLVERGQSSPASAFVRSGGSENPSKNVLGRSVRDFPEREIRIQASALQLAEKRKTERERQEVSGYHLTGCGKTQ